MSTARLVPGWEERCIRVCNENTRFKTGLCIEAHDLALSKLAAFREKDREFVRILLRERMVDAKRLLEMLPDLPVDQTLKHTLMAWISALASELHLPLE